MTTAIILLLSLALAVLVALVGLLIWRNFHQSDELRRKNDVIVREVRRNLELIQQSSRQGS